MLYLLDRVGGCSCSGTNQTNWKFFPFKPTAILSYTILTYIPSSLARLYIPCMEILCHFNFCNSKCTKKDLHCLLSIAVYVGHDFSPKINFNIHLLPTVVDHLHHISELRHKERQQINPISEIHLLTEQNTCMHTTFHCQRCSNCDTIFYCEW